MLTISGIIASANYPRSTTSYESIATVTVGSGGSSSITFSSIPSTYKHLQIRGLSLQNSTNADIQVQFNGDTAANYSLHYLYGQGTSAAASGSANASFIYAAFNAGDSTYPTGMVMDVLNYQNSNKYKTARTLAGFDRNGSGFIILNSGNWRSTAVISSITIYTSTGNFNQYSSFALYGVKG